MLVAEFVYGTPASIRDLARFVFAHGGKDGTPYPVDREAYDQTIESMNAALSSADIDRSVRSKVDRAIAGRRAADRLRSV